MAGLLQPGQVAPVVPQPTRESAVYVLNLLSATGTGILLAAIVGALVMKYRPMEIVRTFFRTVVLVRYSPLLPSFSCWAWAR